MKVSKKPAKRKSKQQRLTVEDMIHWTYMCINSNAGRFKEDSRVTAARFHTHFSTITRRHQRLCDLGCISVDDRTVNVRDRKSGRMLPVAYFVPQPPADYIALARLIWNIYEQEYEVRPPVASVQTVDTLVNSGSEPFAPVQHISAEVFNVDISTVNSSNSLDKETVNSNVPVASVQTVEHRINTGSEPFEQMQTAEPEPEPSFYPHGASIPADQFDSRRIPFCLYCDEQKVGMMRVPRTPEEAAHIELDTYCCDDCEEAHRVEKRQAKDEAHDRMVASWKATGESAR